MKFKEETYKSQFEVIDQRLRAILLEMDYWSQKEFGIEIVITSLIRDEGIHKYARGGDVRSRDYAEEQAIKLRNHMNEFIYDKIRPQFDTCMYGDDAHLDHFHLQVAPN